jgi:hypothetical protein
MFEKVCERCRRILFSEEEEARHDCFDMDDLIDAEIALCNWDGRLVEPDDDDQFPAEPDRVR